MFLIVLEIEVFRLKVRVQFLVLGMAICLLDSHQLEGVRSLPRVSLVQVLFPSGGCHPYDGIAVPKLHLFILKI